MILKTGSLMFGAGQQAITVDTNDTDYRFEFPNRPDVTVEKNAGIPFTWQVQSGDVNDNGNCDYLMYHP